jgi:hypothetical protein
MVARAAWRLGIVIVLAAPSAVAEGSALSVEWQYF